MSLENMGKRAPVYDNCLWGKQIEHFIKELADWTGKGLVLQIIIWILDFKFVPAGKHSEVYMDSAIKCNIV